MFVFNAVKQAIVHFRQSINVLKVFSLFCINNHVFIVQYWEILHNVFYWSFNRLLTLVLHFFGFRLFPQGILYYLGPEKFPSFFDRNSRDTQP